jgi:hypothetical protein
MSRHRAQPPVIEFAPDPPKIEEVRDQSGFNAGTPTTTGVPSSKKDQGLLKLSKQASKHKNMETILLEKSRKQSAGIRKIVKQLSSSQTFRRSMSRGNGQKSVHFQKNDESLQANDNTNVAPTQDENDFDMSKILKQGSQPAEADLDWLAPSTSSSNTPPSTQSATASTIPPSGTTPNNQNNQIAMRTQESEWLENMLQGTDRIPENFMEFDDEHDLFNMPEFSDAPYQKHQ